MTQEQQLPTRQVREAQRQERDRVAQTLKRVLDNVDEELAVWGGPCEGCTYFDLSQYSSLEFANCAHPAVLASLWEPATGMHARASYKRWCKEVRKPLGLCGPQAVLREVKPPKRGWLKSLFYKQVGE